MIVIKIKESALYCMPEPVESAVGSLCDNNEVKENGKPWLPDEVRDTWNKTETDYRRYGNGGLNTIYIKTEDEKTVVKELISANWNYIEIMNMDHPSEVSDLKMEKYLGEKYSELAYSELEEE